MEGVELSTPLKDELNNMKIADVSQDLMNKAQIKDYSSKFQYDRDYNKQEKDQER